MDSRRRMGVWACGRFRFRILDFGFRNTAFCLLPSAFCLLSSAFCLLPTAAQAQTRAPQSLDVPWAMVRSDSMGSGATSVSLLPPWQELVRVSSPYRLTPVVAANDVIYFGSADHNVYAYRLPQAPRLLLGSAEPIRASSMLMQTWRKLWQFSTGADVDAAPAIVGDTVYVASTDHHLYALEAATGELRWRLRFDDDARAAPVVDSGIVYVGADDRMFRAVDAAMGRTLWATELPGEIRAPAAVAGNAVYVACTDHFVYALHRGSGRVIWKTDVGDDVTSPLTLAHARVYGVTLLGRLFALDAATGAFLWTHPYPIMVDTAPAFADGRIFLTRDDGNVVALDAETGEKLWTTAKKVGVFVASLFGANNTPAADAPTVPRARSAGSPIAGGRYVYVNAGIPPAVFVMDAVTGQVSEAPGINALIASPFGPGAAAGPRVVLQDDDSPPRYARARHTAQAHLSLYGDFLFVALPNSLSVIAPSPLPTDGATAMQPLPLRIPENAHIAAALDLYIGPVQPPFLRRQFPPSKTLRTIDRMPVTLDGRRSFDPLRHQPARWLWMEDLGAEPVVRRFFGIGEHRVFLTVMDEEGAESEPAEWRFHILAPVGGASGFQIQGPSPSDK